MSKVLFDSQEWLEEDPKERVDDFLECTSHTREDFNSEDKLLEAVRDWLQETNDLYWDDFKSSCQAEENRYVLVTGYFMSWLGPEHGGKIYKDLTTAVSNIIMQDSHFIYSINDDGVLILDETHHDAPCKGNYFEFRILTAAGEKYYETHKYDDPRSLHEALKLHGRTRNVNTKIFGF